MATIKELLSAMIDKINGNEDKIDNIKGVPEAFDSITMTNGTDMANLTMSAEKELLFNGEAVGDSSDVQPLIVQFIVDHETNEVTSNLTAEEIYNASLSGKVILASEIVTHEFTRLYNLDGFVTWENDGNPYYEVYFKAYDWFPNGDGYVTLFYSIKIIDSNKGIYEKTPQLMHTVG